MSSVNLYPQIDEIFLETLKITFKRRYYYYGSDGKEYNVIEKKIKGMEDKEIFDLDDENSEYDQSNDTLYLDLDVSIYNAKYLFGKSGYVYLNTVLGIGIEWKSKKSKIRHCKKLGSFNYSNSNGELLFRCNKIELNELTSDTEFSWVIFIKEPGTVENGLFFANKEGLIIGKKIVWTIKGEGIGSLFPISEISSPNEPLWCVKTSFDDPFVEEFSIDNVAILINKSHPSYQFIQSNNKYYNQNFLSEVLSSALYILIVEIKCKVDDFQEINKKHSDTGSIVEALKYFDKELNFKIFDSEKELLRSIKLFFDKEFK